MSSSTHLIPDVDSSLKSSRVIHQRKGRIRIAQVLADARYEASSSSSSQGRDIAASLEHPSRPYTPASYDEKMHLDSLVVENKRYRSIQSRAAASVASSSSSTYIQRQLKENFSINMGNKAAATKRVARKQQLVSESFDLAELNARATSDSDVHNDSTAAVVVHLSSYNKSPLSEKLSAVVNPLVSDLRELEMSLEHTSTHAIMSLTATPVESALKLLKGALDLDTGRGYDASDRIVILYRWAII
jgi:hypothetical protein